ncbi:MAG TPA: hypothetical protein VG225_12335 [Terracidiphilus sp.]|jgi:hypothetical protein|nr:hypothetical protein [Terracidiphilus sp.]
MLCGYLVLFGAAVCAAQQDPLTIRIESGRIVVPVAWSGQVTCEVHIHSSDVCGWDAEWIPAHILEEKNATPFSLGILSADKFRLIEDGNQKQIENFHLATAQDIEVWLDNLGAHTEEALGPRGIWSTSDQAPEVIKSARSSHIFLISYSPSGSPQGSCHSVTIKAPHASMLVYNKEYCIPLSPTSDSLQGATEGKKLASYLSSGKQGSIHPLVQSTAFYEAPGKARVNIDIELPFKEVGPKSWKDGTLASALLIMAYTKSGQVAGRLSEQVQEDAMFEKFSMLEPLKEAAETVTSTRYDGQMELAPGEYKLAIAYSHGKDFGLAEVPLTVDDYNGKEFAISSIAVCKRVRASGDVPVAKDFVPLVAGSYQFTPAGDTAFRKGDSLMAYFELYEPTPLMPQQPLHVNYTMRIRNEQTGAVVLQTVENADSWIHHGNTTIPIAVEPVLSKLNLAPSGYRFEIQATDSAGRRTPLRTAEFSIE